MRELNRVAQFAFISNSNIDKIASTDYAGKTPSLKLPERATVGSAGYDFYSPFDFTLKAGETIKLPTFIRCKIDDGWVLMMCPRSGLGFKFRLQLDNTIGIIDSDYYYSDNEGHIMIKLTNDSKEGKALEVKAGDAIAQGLFIPYGITMTDTVTAIRNGGFGSTSERKI